jgi:glutathione S-transferase
MLELHQFEGCPWCARVRETLDDLGLDYIVRTAPHDPADRDRVRAVSGQDLVPVLVDPERSRVVVDSRQIVAYLRAAYPRHA